LDRRRGGEPRFSGAIDVDSGRRSAHRRHHLPYRDGASGNVFAKRGAGNYCAIAAQAIAPALAGALPLRQAIDAVASARAAASLDPEGEALAKCLAGLARTPVHAIAAE